MPSNPQEDIARLREAVERDPTDVGALFRLALALRDHEDYADALHYAERCADLAPDNPELAQLVALCLHLTGEVEQSAPWYARAIELGSQSAILYFNAGVAADHMLQYEEAAQHYRAALEIEPGYSDALNNLGIVLAKLGRYGDASKAFHALLELRDAPDRPKAHNNLGLVYLHQGKTADAILSFRAAIALDAAFSIAWMNLGNAYYVAGDAERSEAAHQAAIRTDPDNVMAYQALGALTGVSETPSEAVLAEYEAYLDTHPWSALVYYNLGIALAERGSIEEAKVQLDKALLMEPHFEEARRVRDILEENSGA